MARQDEDMTGDAQEDEEEGRGGVDRGGWMMMEPSTGATGVTVVQVPVQKKRLPCARTAGVTTEADVQ